ncbi:ribonuclease H-like protein, partial [Exidia glandulosa HHB12029]
LLHEVCNQTRTWKEAMGELYGPITAVASNPIHVATDGSCIGNGRTRAAAGAGVYWGPGNSKNTSVRLHGALQTNNRAQLLAVLVAIDAADPARKLIIHSDSEYAIRSVAEWAPARAELGWHCTNADLLRSIQESIARRGAAIHFNWVPGHKGNSWNEAADGLAREGAA